MTTFVFDGSFDGFLTVIFEFYERGPKDARIITSAFHQPSLVGDDIIVISDQAKSQRVWTGLKKKIGAEWRNRFYKAFLSECTETHQHLLDFARYIFDNPAGAENNFGHPAVIGVVKADKSVNREKHRMKAFVRFQETADGIFYAPVEPDYNVLPLIAGFFKNRYADQKWIIYDVKRKYGLYYNLQTVEEVIFDFLPEAKADGIAVPDSLQAGKEALYSLLWGDYFRSTNIPARKNMKLHLQHVPKRYWKYLNEKNGLN